MFTPGLSEVSDRRVRADAASWPAGDAFHKIITSAALIADAESPQCFRLAAFSVTIAVVV